MKETREEQLIEAVKNHEEIERFKKSDAYKILIAPVQKELENLKHSYDCTTVAEIKYNKGKKDGLSLVLSILEEVDREGVAASESLARLEKRRRVDSMEIDSTDL